MKTNFLFLLLFCWCAHLAAVEHPVSPTEKAEDYLQDMESLHHIPGMVVAVIKDGKVIYQRSRGVANLEHQVAVGPQTLFPVFSTTKLLSSVAVFQLIEAGKLALEDQISDHLDDLPAAWYDRKIKHLLTHSSGLPDFVHLGWEVKEADLLPELSKQDLEFPAGQMFRYNQTNYWLLQRIIEQLSGQSFGDFVIDQQFAGQGDGVAFTSDDLAVIPHRSTRYFFNKGVPEKAGYRSGSFAHSSNGLSITLQQLIAWNERLDQGQLLGAATKAQLWQEFEFGNEQDHFLHGWGRYGDEAYSIGFTGGGVSGFRKFPAQNMTIIYLSNAFSYFPIHNKVIDRLAGIFDPSLADPRAEYETEISRIFLKISGPAALDAYLQLKQKSPNIKAESTMNSLGYALASNGRMEDALQLFQLNVREFPDSWNVYDSLGEGYEMSGDYPKAIEYYRKSVALNPENQHGIDKIKLLSE